MARNTNRQGANFELDVMKHLDAFGYTSLRSSGSRGAVDIVSVAPLHEHWAPFATPPLFIQCKITNPLISPAERLAVQDLALRAGAVPLVASKAVDRVTRRAYIYFRQLTGPGPKDWTPWAPGKDD